MLPVTVYWDTLTNRFAVIGPRYGSTFYATLEQLADVVSQAMRFG